MKVNWQCGSWQFWITLCIVVSGVAEVGFGRSVLAQIIPDDTLSVESSTVMPLNEQADRIDGGATRGSSLFHSFQEFNINEGRGVYFANPAEIENIFSRVTGNNPSHLLGTLGVLGDANLFFLNPNGVIFGPNAKLDLRGSLVTSTANSLLFPDGNQFSATNPEAAPLLTIDVPVPIGLQFEGENPGDIKVQGSNLEIDQGKTLGLIGGDVFLDNAKLLVPGVRIELGGLAETGTLILNAKGNELNLAFPSEVARANVILENSSEVNVRAGDGGDIAINAQNLKVLSGSKLRAGIATGMGSSQSQAGDIVIDATGVITIDGNESLISNGVEKLAVGNTGDLEINTNSLLVSNGAAINTLIEGQGDAGKLKIIASETVSFDGDESRADSTVSLKAEGRAAGIDITANFLSVKNQAVITTDHFGTGSPGDIKIHATDIAFDGGDAQSFLRIGAEGNAGNIDITTDSLKFTNGAQLSTTTVGNGDAGNIMVKAHDYVILDGVEPVAPTKGLNGASSGLLALTDLNAKGKGGDISVNTPSLSLSDGAVISARTRSNFPGGNITVEVNTLKINRGAQILTAAFRGGNAGNIKVNGAEQIILSGADFDFYNRFNNVKNFYTQETINRIIDEIRDFFKQLGINFTRLDILNNFLNLNQLNQEGRQFGKNRAEFFIDPVGPFSGLFANTQEGSTGKGGNIEINPNTVIIRNGAQIAVNSDGNGVGGNIDLQAGSLTLDNKAEISAETASLDGGDIKLQIYDDPLLLRRNSSISTNAGTGQDMGGNGGNITINAPFIIAFPTENSDITANAFKGNGGNIKIFTNVIFGIEERDRLTSLSDFTASSEFGVDGEIDVETLGIDPTRGLIILPEEPVNPEISQGCQTVRGKEAVEYFEIGRGGLPPNPDDSLNADEVLQDWIPLESESENGSDSGTTIDSPHSAKTQLISPCPAQ